MSENSSADVRLARLKDNDAEQLAMLANNRKIWDCVRDFFPHPYRIEDANNFIQLCQRENPPVNFGIFYRDELAGVCGLVPGKDVQRISAEIGYWLGESFWNKGIASRAVELLVDYAFNTLNLHRVEAGVFDFNQASKRVLEKCGFTLEAIHRQSLIKNGRILDDYFFARLNPKDLI